MRRAFLAGGFLGFLPEPWEDFLASADFLASVDFSVDFLATADFLAAADFLALGSLALGSLALADFLPTPFPLRAFLTAFLSLKDSKTTVLSRYYRYRSENFYLFRAALCSRAGFGAGSELASTFFFRGGNLVLFVVITSSSSSSTTATTSCGCSRRAL